MYGNIHKEEDLHTIKRYLNTYCHKSDKSFDTPLVIDLLALILIHSMFKFGDTWWVQETGTAMGMPYACICATLFFAWFERQILLRNYWKNILYYKRSINDIVGIWIDDQITHILGRNLTIPSMNNVSSIGTRQNCLHQLSA